MRFFGLNFATKRSLFRFVEPSWQVSFPLSLAQRARSYRERFECAASARRLSSARPGKLD